MESIAFETGNCYHLKGNNGTGKTSFLRKVLFPFLQRHPYQQYILYIEQQVQSQYDAVRAYAALKKPSVVISDDIEMIGYQIKMINEARKFEPRPLMILLDEPSNPEIVAHWLSSISLDNICLLYVSHTDIEYNSSFNPCSINFESLSMNLSLVKLHDDML
jgi:hypothetical protein